MTIFTILIVLAMIFAILSLIPVGGGVPWLNIAVLLVCIALLFGHGAVSFN